MHFAPGSSRMICSGKDGSILVYHMLKHQVYWFPHSSLKSVAWIRELSWSHWHHLWLWDITAECKYFLYLFIWYHREGTFEDPSNRNLILLYRRRFGMWLISVWGKLCMELTVLSTGFSEIKWSFFIFTSCSWSPNSKRIAASTISGAILIFDVETTRVIAKFSYHEKVSFSRDSPQLLST